MYRSKRDNYILECFSNVSELYNNLKDRKRRPGAEDSSEEKGMSFTGTHSLEEAYDLMIHGDKELCKRINEKAKNLDINKLLGNAIKRNTTYNSVVGYQVNVPNYLSGIPTDMITSIPNRVSQKIINIVVNASVSCGVSTSDIEKAGSYYYIVIDLLEKAGYRCNVYSMVSYDHYDKGILLARVKTDKEPINREKMAFLLAHPSFHRRINFKWIECIDCKGEPTRAGYGTPITNNEEIKKIIDKELKADFIVWSVQQDYKVSIEKIIENLEKQGIKIGE
jgi:methanogenic corrinoid protein MtbC1